MAAVCDQPHAPVYRLGLGDLAGMAMKAIRALINKAPAMT